jgi:signal transduction histidine kinase
MEQYVKTLESRFLAIPILAIFGLFLNEMEIVRIGTAGLWVTVAFFTVYSLFVWANFKKGLFSWSKNSIFLWVAQFGDILFLSVIIYFLGSYQTIIIIVLYYMLVINSFSPHRYRLLTFLKANVSMVCFGSILALEHLGYLAHQDVGTLFLNPFEQGALLIFGTLSINACAIFKINSESRLRQQAQAIQAVNETLEERVSEQTKELKSANQEIKWQMEELKGAYKKLVQSEKLASLGTMIGGLYHEVFNPLHQISLGNAAFRKYSEYLFEVGENLRKKVSEVDWQESTWREDERTWEEVKERLEKLYQQIGLSTQRINQLVRNVKKFSRTDDAELVEVDLNELTHTVLNILSPAVEEKEAEIRLKIPEKVILRGMPGPLNQVFMNILKNAVDAIDQKGAISLEITLQGDYLVVRIKDNGIGIDPDHLDRVFDPFYTSKGPDKGTGLGLSISHRIIRSHEGEIRINSLKGKGTTVYVNLPQRGPKSMAALSQQ